MGWRKTMVLFAIGSFCIMAMTGCETAKASAKGVAKGVGDTTVEVAKGVKKDVKSFGTAVRNADTWVRKNLW